MRLANQTREREHKEECVCIVVLPHTSHKAMGLDPYHRNAVQLRSKSILFQGANGINMI